MDPVISMRMHQYNASIMREHIRWVEGEMGTQTFRDCRECSNRIFSKIESSDSLEKARQLVDKLRELAARVSREAQATQVPLHPATATKAEGTPGDGRTSDFCVQWINGPDDAYEEKQCIEVCWLGWNPSVGDSVGAGYVFVRKSTCFGHGLMFKHVAIGKPSTAGKSNLSKCAGALSNLGLGKLMNIINNGGSQLAFFTAKAMRCCNMGLMSCMALLLMISTFKYPLGTQHAVSRGGVGVPIVPPPLCVEAARYVDLNDTSVPGAKRSMVGPAPTSLWLDKLAKRHRW
ncbi:hypothetical protein JKP88DRAFT_251642 [Tribonema minus]|uniref:Uncharacterized protein n=1 Tax=Tribonema minus TaxID=303371 RepID=A0A835ZM37_9STRA|nr:hypothetical protein JKP88DRAFT_251642 [Tribonema minus]